MLQVNKTKDAIELAGRVLKKYPSSSFTYCLLGEAWQQQGNKNEAKKNLEMALKFDPGNAEARRELSKVNM